VSFEDYEGLALYLCVLLLLLVAEFVTFLQINLEPKNTSACDSNYSATTNRLKYFVFCHNTEDEHLKNMWVILVKYAF
jgi:hypothetical protein